MGTVKRWFLTYLPEQGVGSQWFNVTYSLTDSEKGESQGELIMADFLFRETYKGCWADTAYPNRKYALGQEETRILKHVKNYGWW